MKKQEERLCGEGVFSQIHSLIQKPGLNLVLLQAQT